MIVPGGRSVSPQQAIRQSIDVQLGQGEEIDVATIISDLQGFNISLDQPSGVGDLTVRQLLKQILEDVQRGSQSQGTGAPGAGQNR